MERKRACVLGAGGGIGAALVAALGARDYDVHAGARGPLSPEVSHAKRFCFDLCDEGSLAAAAERVGADGPLDLVIVATGTLHRNGDLRPERSYRDLDASAMREVFAINAIGPALAARYFIPLLARDRRAVMAFLSARVGSIGDNRLGGWHSYRASKASLNALVRCFAIELARQNREAIVAALHPGTVDTPMSMPFQKNVRPEQLFSPRESARHLLAVIDGLTPGKSGGFFAWDGTSIEY